MPVSSPKDTCDKFARQFPSTYKIFDSLYGYDDQLGKAPLYDNYQQHIDYFFDCQQMPTNIKLQKAIAICLGGKWEADAVGLFQDRTLELIKKYPDEALNILNRYSERDAASFWRFLFDGPHPGDKANQANVNYLIARFGNDEKQSQILKGEFEKLVASDSH